MQQELEALTLALGDPARPVVGDRRRRQGVDQARTPRQSRDQGRRARHRRRHGQHLPVRRGQGRRQVAVREGPCRRRARSIAAAAEKAKCRILLPVDATVAKELKAHAPAHVVSVDHVPEDEMILDIGPKSVGGRRGSAGPRQDAGVERPVRRVRNAALRRGDDGDREDGRGAHQGRQAQVGCGRRRHGRGAQRGQGRGTTSLMSRPRAGRSSNGWKARRCRGSRR